MSYSIYNGVLIHQYSTTYSEEKSDLAIVLGAGTTGGKISSVFAERVNHAKYLFDKGIINKVLITGGFGKGQKLSDSEIGRQYLFSQGIPMEAILIEKKSRYTIENLFEAKAIMDSLKLSTALIISDPLHMKRAIELAKEQNIDCYPSPTKTTMYRSFFPKAKFLIYETFYFTLGKIVGRH